MLQQSYITLSLLYTITGQRTTNQSWDTDDIYFSNIYLESFALTSLNLIFITEIKECNFEASNKFKIKVSL